MQRIRIVIADGKAQKVEIEEIKSKTTKRKISKLLRAMPETLSDKTMKTKS